MPLEKASELQPGISQEQFKPSNEQMWESIKASMEHLEEEVSDMVEILEVLQQELIKDSNPEMI